MAKLHGLVIVLGDPLDINAAAFERFEASLEAAWVTEVAEEATHVWSSKPRVRRLLDPDAGFPGTKRPRCAAGPAGLKALQARAVAIRCGEVGVAHG